MVTRTQSRTDRGGSPQPWSATHFGWSRIGKDQGHYIPHSVFVVYRGGASGEYPGAHVYKQGGGGDEVARGNSGGWRFSAAVNLHVPFLLRAPAAATHPLARLYAGVFDL